MANVFLVTYGGRANNGNTYVPYKAIAHTADEAIAVINTWNTYGKSDSQAANPEWLHIKVNATTEQKIRNRFRDGLGSYPSGAARTCETMRTTGCGEEHERIYNEQREAAKRERMRQAEAAKQRRLAELYEQRRGWYHVELDLRLSVFNNHGNDYRTDMTFSGNVIADSGMDAYDKAVKDIKNDGFTHRGNIAMLESWADPESHGYSFAFLGVKTDEGYSVEKWEEWKKNGEI